MYSNNNNNNNLSIIRKIRNQALRSSSHWVKNKNHFVIPFQQFSKQKTKMKNIKWINDCDKHFLESNGIRIDDLFITYEKETMLKSKMAIELVVITVDSQLYNVLKYRNIHNLFNILCECWNHPIQNSCIVHELSIVNRFHFSFISDKVWVAKVMSFEFRVLNYGSSCSPRLAFHELKHWQFQKYIYKLFGIHPLIIIIFCTFFTIHCSLVILKHFQVSRWADELCLIDANDIFFPMFSEIINKIICVFQLHEI